MFDNFDSPDTPLNEDLAFQLLQEVEKSTSDEVRRQRAHFRLAVRAGVTLQSGNSSELLSYKIKGMTGDISEGGCCGLFPLPVRVGDIHRLQIDREVLDLPLIFARCVRCRLVREDAFEAGFTFFSPITLPDNLAVSSDAFVQEHGNRDKR
ncbi:MAG: PilZ domain-containing protein [Planctomycetota bacterium]